MRTLDVLKTAGIRRGDEVIVPGYGPLALSEAVVQAGGVPVHADIDPHTYCLAPASVTDVLTPRTAAVVAVHRFGHPADTAGLHAVADRHHLLLHLDDDEHTEDTGSHARGTEGVADRHAAGTPDTAARRADEAARRLEHAAYLSGHLRGVLTPHPSPGHTYRRYVVRVEGNGRPDRDAFARALRGRGVECRVPMRAPVYRMRGFRRDVFLPETERAVDETLELPAGPEMTRRDLHRVVQACKALGGLLQPAF